MRWNNHQGFSIIEAVASIFIVTLLLTTAIAILINVRNQTMANNLRLQATEVGTQIRDEIINSATYLETATWMNGQAVTVTNVTCPLSIPPFGCSVFSHIADGDLYDANVTLVFAAPTTESTAYQVIHFTIVIAYESDRTIELAGIIYE